MYVVEDDVYLLRSIKYKVYVVKETIPRRSVSFLRQQIQKCMYAEKRRHCTTARLWRKHKTSYFPIYVSHNKKNTI